MAVERKKWTQRFTWERMPSWPCPHCAEGLLKRKEKKGLLEEETAESRKLHEHPGWDPDWIRGRFAAILRCSTCAGLVVMAGSTEVEFVAIAGDPYNLETYFRPSGFDPAPPLFRIPDRCPPDVRKELGRAWNLFWVDSAACANRIRSCVEMILTSQRVKRFARDKHGKRVQLSLHSRILLYGKRDSAIADEMMAVKWLGNTGSHGAEQLSTSDMFDGFDLLEHLLEEVVAQRTKVLARIRRDLIRRKGRPRKSREPKLT